MAHSRLTGLVVAEAATAVALVRAPPTGVSSWLTGAGLALLAAIWLSTALLQSPRHRKLGGGLDPASHSSLVASNWLRTVCRSVRGPVVLWMVEGAAGQARTLAFPDRSDLTYLASSNKKWYI